MPGHLLLMELGFTASFLDSSSDPYFMLYSILHSQRRCHNLKTPTRARQVPKVIEMDYELGKRKHYELKKKKETFRVTGSFLSRRGSSYSVPVHCCCAKQGPVLADLTVGFFFSGQS